MTKQNRAYFKDGEMLHCLYKWMPDEDKQFYVEGKFHDELKFVKYTDGSSVNVTFESLNTGIRYITTMYEFEKMMLNIPSKNGVFTGWFTFKKQGQRYSLIPLFKQPEYHIEKKPLDRSKPWQERLQERMQPL
jgi:hypothetical protein